MADDIFVSNDIELDVDFGEVFIIDQGVVTKVIANKYNPTQTYDVGDYVINVDKLYKCITAVVEPEEFDNTKWENVKLANEVQSLNEIVPTKADKADTYTKTETNTLLSNKADKSNTYTKSEVDTALANKVDTDTLDNYYTKDNVYTKTEVNDNLALKADKADTYTKGDVNDYLALKADKSDTYTKSETDTALNAKADSDSVYDKSETYSKTEVDNKIANLPAPMIMKGTLGTGGTITDLPTASSENEGFTYKVITDGTYAGQAAKTGDLFTSAKPVGSSDYIWLYIPSGDETFTDTWRGIKVNGTEKLGSAISSGEVDFIDGTNTTVTFNSTGNKIKVDVDGYTQAQVDNKLALKANSADVYNKSAVDSALALKANTADVYNKTTADEKYALKADKATTYTKTEVDDITTLVKSASGNPCNFETDIADNLVSLKAAIVASGGNGTPSTPIPIVGHSELNLVRCGVNLWDEETESGYINSSTGAEVSDPSKIRMKNYVRVGANSTYFYKTPVAFYICCYDESKTFLGRVGGSRDTTFTTLPNTAYIRCGFESAYGTTYNHDISINCPSTDTSYHAYNGTPYLVSFGQTVYGGEYDKSGRLTITHKEFVIDENFNPYSGFPNADNTARIFQIQISDMVTGSDTTPLMCDICNVKTASQLYNDNDYAIAPVNGNNAIAIMIKDTTTGADARTWLASHNITVVYPLATPIEIDVSELSVETIVGTNNIISDGGGDIEQLTYFESVGMKIQKGV